MPPPVTGRWSIALHGGAGVISKNAIDARRQQEYVQALQKALNIGVTGLKGNILMSTRFFPFMFVD